MVSLFRKNSIASTILNVLGMTAAFAALYVILVQVRYDLTYNHGIKDSDRVYVMTLPDWYEEGKYMMWLNRPLQEQIQSSLPDIEAGGCGYLSGHSQYIKKDKSSDKIEVKESSFSEGGFKVFGFEAVQGSLDDLTAGDQVAVSESFARKMGLSVGSVFYSVNYDGDSPLNVVAIYKDFPKASDLSSFDYVTEIGNENLDSWQEWSYPYFVKLKSPEDKDAAEKKSTEIAMEVLKEQYGEDSDGSEEDMDELFKRMTYHFISIRDTYFDPLLSNNDGASGNKTTTLTLLAIAVMILVISMVNYVNFFMALIPVRIRSINIRKVIGASRTSLVMGMIAESVLLTAISLALAAIVVVLFGRSDLASLISTSIGLGSNMGIAVLTVAVAIAVSILASLYPALYSTSVPPALSLKGSFAATHKGKAIRYALIGIQFTISMALIICAIFINLQRKFMLNHDLGFDKENLLTLDVGYRVGSQREQVGERLKKNPGIIDVAWADGRFINDTRMGWGREIHGQQCEWQCYPVSWNFLSFMKIPILEGRDFVRSDEDCENGIFIFNEEAKKEFGLTLEDKVSGHSEPTDIAGFCADFNFASLRTKVMPFSFFVFGKEPWRGLKNIFIRTAPGADFKELKEFIANTLAEYDSNSSADDFQVSFFDDTLQAVYSKESKLSSLITLFTILAIIISLMGVFGLVMIEAEGRRKEIGVRRVNGATVEEILKMLNSKFVYIVLICFVIAAPLSIFIMRAYLNNFAYRIGLHPWVFIVALLAVLIVTIAVVTLRSWRAATANPVESLRTE
jgi:putative ABC transport system permease protein